MQESGATSPVSLSQMTAPDQDAVQLRIPGNATAALASRAMTARSMTSLQLLRRDATLQYVGPATARMTVRDMLEAVLDDMRVRGQRLFGRYSILSSLERRGGGQGCVQFVHDPAKRRDLAVKFLFKLDAFEREATLYADPVLRAMMAATRHVDDNADSALMWMRRMLRRNDGGKLPLVAIFQALINIAERLQLLHQAGYVHGDIKPSNVLWLADMHAWTLIDFGSAVKAGMRSADVEAARRAKPPLHTRSVTSKTVSHNVAESPTLHGLAQCRDQCRLYLVLIIVFTRAKCT
jgi:Phosphotransferase enzyme family